MSIDLAVYDRQTATGRSNWTISFKAGDVAKHSLIAADYHRERQQWWEAEQVKAKEAISAGGWKLHEQPITGGMHHQIVADPALSNRLSECENKIATHLQKAQQLDSWTLFLNANPSKFVTLTAADVEFFEIGRHNG